MDIEPLLLSPVDPGIALAARYMQELAAGSALPKRQDFRPSQVRPVLGYIFLIDILPDLDDFRYSLLGEHIRILYGIEATNMRMSQLGHEAQFAILRKTYQAVIKAQSFHYLRGRYTWPDRFVAIERLLVPMTDNDGHLNSIFGISIPDAPTDALPVFAGLIPARLEIDEQISGSPLV
jgi:hypothetical protein